MNESSERIRIQVAYALPERQADATRLEKLTHPG